MQRPTRIIVLYNSDYDTEASATDVVSVESSAREMAGALASEGFEVDVIGLHGREVLGVVERLHERKPDLVFNLCESMDGDSRNEPTFVGLLELYGLPYTGTDLLGLASCLHKRRTKEILIARGISTPPYRFFPNVAALADPTLDDLDYPWFLKLAHEDASIGITEENYVATPQALRKRAKDMMEEFGQPVLAERYIEGRELNVALIGNGADLEMMPLHEIDFGAMPTDRPRIVSYAAKWEEGHVDYIGTKPVPVRGTNPALLEAVERTARGAWDALGLRDYGRIDLRVDANEVPWVIDVNPNPDVSPDAGVARSAKVAGLTYSQLIAKIALVAHKRVLTTPPKPPGA